MLDEIPRFGDDRLENRYLGVKLEIPTFDGNVNPEKYLEWEMRLDQIFEAQTFDDERRIALATVHLTNYALLWWDNQKKTVMPWHPIHSWEELKARFRVRWVPFIMSKSCIGNFKLSLKVIRVLKSIIERCG